MSWLEKLLPSKIQQTDPADRRTVPEGLWVKCPSCETVLYKNDLEENQNVCPKCSHHHRISARARLDAFLDPEGRYEIGQEVLPMDPLKFKDSRKYPERLKEALENTGETDALVVMGGAVVILFFLPWLDNCAVKSIRYRPDWHVYLYAIFVINFFVLGYLGIQPPSAIGERVSQIGTLFYFGFFLLMPWWSRMGETKPVPDRVNFVAH